MLAAGLLLVATLAHGEPVREQQRDLPGVARVVIETPGALQIRASPEARLTIRAEARVQEALDASVEGDTLFLRSKGFSTRQELSYLVLVPRLHSVSCRGSGNTVVEAFRGDRLAVEAAGSGDVTLDGIEMNELNLKVSGSGGIEAIGGGASLIAEIAGSGEIRAERYAVKSAEARIGGSGEIRVRAGERLAAAISGAGSIRYAGQPVIEKSISGAGSVDPL
jgi:hypothetical protein